ncbi:MAG: hypothetical protein RLP44_27345 [Aggregatilineales bacterium]
MSDEPEKSIAQIVAGIKAKVHDIDVRLNAIEVGELPETALDIWQIALESVARLRTFADNFPQDFKTQWDARVAIFDLHSATAPILYSLDILDIDYAELSGEMPAELHAILADVNRLRESYYDLGNLIIATE